VTLATPAVAAAISDFVERYALGASAATLDRARDGVARVTLAAEEVAVPREVAAIFAETISLFALHLYVNSAGVRYVPVPAPREVLLVETHAEGDEPVTPLLRELGLQQRRLARDDIEAALRKHGRACSPTTSVSTRSSFASCACPGRLVRVGRDRGWGQRQEWTHFDGYQIAAGGRLRPSWWQCSLRRPLRPRQHQPRRRAREHGRALRGDSPRAARRADRVRDAAG
jgi:hypothetical protein